LFYFPVATQKRRVFIAIVICHILFKSLLPPEPFVEFNDSLFDAGVAALVG